MRSVHGLKEWITPANTGFFESDDPCCNMIKVDLLCKYAKRLWGVSFKVCVLVNQLDGI